MLIEPIANSATVRRPRDPITSVIRYSVAWSVVVLAPLLVFLVSGYEEPFADPTLRATAIAGTSALFTGLFLAGRVLDLPGTRGTVHGVPIMVMCFIIAALVLFAGRVEYSRVVLFYSATTATLIATQLRWSNRTLRRQPFYIVPFGKAHLMEEMKGFPIRRLKRPDIPADRAANIVADFRADLPEEWERLLARASLAGVPVYHYKQLTESITGQVKIESLSENSFGSLMPNRSYTPVKRLIDFFGSLVLIVLLAPVMAVVALLIWAEDRDSPFYIQTRTGLGGRPFRMYKFRSMTNRAVVSAEEARVDAITQEDDARITKFGAFIRKYRLDELPQLFNVLKGEM
ncbi:MAG: sugar transferase, partial [Erythrobacter sp.]|nr:sugar transferase [Erythrobacter sp.]